MCIFLVFLMLVTHIIEKGWDLFEGGMSRSSKVLKVFPVPAK